MTDKTPPFSAKNLELVPSNKSNKTKRMVPPAQITKITQYGLDVLSLIGDTKDANFDSVYQAFSEFERASLYHQINELSKKGLLWFEKGEQGGDQMLAKYRQITLTKQGRDVLARRDQLEITRQDYRKRKAIKNEMLKPQKPQKPQKPKNKKKPEQQTALALDVPAIAPQPTIKEIEEIEEPVMNLSKDADTAMDYFSALIKQNANYRKLFEDIRALIDAELKN